MAKAKKKTAVKKVVKEVVSPKEMPERIIDIESNLKGEPIIPEAPEVAMNQVEYEELQKVKARYIAEEKAIAIKKADYSYFADCDKGSSVPAWMLPRPTEDLEREVNKLGSMIKNRQIPDEEIYTAEEDYKRKKTRLEEIKNSKPTLTGMQKDRLRQVRDRLAEDISDSMFTRLEMERYLVDAHEEARRMSEPCIQVDKVEANRMNIAVDKDGKVSRSNAEMMWKMASSLLGDTPDNPNTEELRRDNRRAKRNMITVPVDIANGKVIYPEQPVTV